MRCPYCNSLESQVKDSRPDADDNSIRRRRICEKCGAKFTTVERVQLRDLQVRKRDGSVEPFDRSKIKKSIQVACQKRNIPDSRIETVTSSLHRQLETVSDDVIPSETIGNMVSESLLVLDPIAFIRFASVYRKFSKISEFKKIISEIPELDEGGQNVQSSKKFANGKLF
ncbi:MAG: transcriptional regulator NrdR [Rickettsiales bacterium]|jgi:transcriptional repressor NrdR|nr:transcriptional regulator NrdR [Rickettsiales bacterium]